MQYYILDCLGQGGEEKYCFVTCRPEGFRDPKLSLKNGGSLKDVYPKDPFEVIMYLDEDHPKHIKQGSFIGNTDGYFIVDSSVVDELKKFNIGEVEFWPFTLINHKGRVHSKAYCFVCPVKQYDVLSFDKSEIDRSSKGTVIGIDKIVLENKKMTNIPDIIRINDTRRFALSEPLVTVLLEKYTNFKFDKVEQA